MKVMSRDGTTIAYDRTGEGLPLVLVDPASGFRGWGPMVEPAEALAKDFTVFRYDRRGRGESTDTTPYAVEREVEDLAAVIEAAGGSAFVYGYSSGAVLALHAAAHGLPIRKLALFEPPLAGPDEPADEHDLGAEVTALVAAGKRGEAFMHFQRTIGVPEPMLDGLRESPAWPALEALAHTLAYDTTITSTLPLTRLHDVRTPTLVINSDGSDERLKKWARGVADALPNGAQRTLPGQWHGVDIEHLPVALHEFLLNSGTTPSTVHVVARKEDGTA